MIEDESSAVSALMELVRLRKKDGRCVGGWEQRWSQSTGSVLWTGTAGPSAGGPGLLDKAMLPLNLEGWGGVSRTERRWWGGGSSRVEGLASEPLQR